NSPPQMPPIGGYPAAYGYYPQEDEINLIDLWKVLAKKKMTILGTTVLATIGAVIFALIQPPVYQAETAFLPPSESNVQALSVQGVSLDDTYIMFKKNLSSRAPRKVVFEKLNLLDQLAPERDESTNVIAVFESFNESFSVSSPKPKKGESSTPLTTLSMKGQDPALIAEIVNRVAEESERMTKQELISNARAKIDARATYLKQSIALLRAQTKQQRLDEIDKLESINSLNQSEIKDRLNSLVESTKQKRLDRIATLQEAAEIAHSLGIKEAIGFSLRKIGEAQAQAQAKLDISKLGSQLYNRGYDALEAEITTLTHRKSDTPFSSEIRTLQKELKLLETNRKVEQLKNRKNDDPFIPSLREKEGELSRLTAIHIDPATISVAHLDQVAYPPESRIKPKRKLIVVLGFVLGLMLGIFGAFFSNFFENQRKEEEEAVTV
ncbi:MAG: hypothetical protein HOL30_05375, partial [Thiotrichales bacterium]|nr:hypothetical protein [Thiotrichales bacterium]